MKRSRNPYLTLAMHRFLSAIRDSKDSYAIEEGREVWVDGERFGQATLKRCLRLCLVRQDQYSSGPTYIWLLTECGRQTLACTGYVPLIVAALVKGGAEQEGQK